MNGGKEASDEDLEHLLLGDDFLDEERLQEQRAKERRLARKRRLEALEPTRSEKEEEEERGPVPVVERIETRLESPKKPKTEEGAHDEGTTIPEVDGVRDEFDIFSSSSLRNPLSPLHLLTNKFNVSWEMFIFFSLKKVFAIFIKD